MKKLIFLTKNYFGNLRRLQPETIIPTEKIPARTSAKPVFGNVWVLFCVRFTILSYANVGVDLGLTVEGISAFCPKTDADGVALAD